MHFGKYDRTKKWLVSLQLYMRLFLLFFFTVCQSRPMVYHRFPGRKGGWGTAYGIHITIESKELKGKTVRHLYAH